jgi:hypothetical protein
MSEAAKDLRKNWMKDPQYRDAHGALAPEFDLARAVIDGPVQPGPTPDENAAKTETAQAPHRAS